MEDYISISMLNDFIFCPYSIYLHNVYRDMDEDIYHASSQTAGREAHSTIDNKKYSSKRRDIVALPVISHEFGIIGKIDLYNQEMRELIERKYVLKKIYRGQMYQLWAEYYCMTEMGYSITSLSFYEISTNKKYPVSLPDDTDKNELMSIINHFKVYNPSIPVAVNNNKCSHCIYNNLCDKTEVENVYS